MFTIASLCFLPNRQCALLDYTTVQEATQAQAALHGVRIKNSMLVVEFKDQTRG
jgi:hypothetical protein